MTQGYVTAATQRRKHLEMAVDLALSLREVDPGRGVTVVVDRKNLDLVERRYPTVFDRVVLVPEEHGHGYAPKLFAAEASPYDRTLFLDADCLVLRSLDELWGLLEPYGFTMMGETFRPHPDLHHNNIPTTLIAERFGLDRYFLCFGVLFYFNRHTGREVLQECLDLYNGPLRNARYWRWDTLFTADELAIGIVGGRRELGRFPAYHPIITWRECPGWRPGEAPRPVFHCTFWPPPDVMDWMMDGVRRRRVAAGIPGGSEGYWRRKAWVKRIQDLTAGRRRRKLVSAAQESRVG